MSLTMKGYTYDDQRNWSTAALPHAGSDPSSNEFTDSLLSRSDWRWTTIF